MSITLAIDAGMASYFGWGATGAAEGAGRDAARAAAIDGAAIFLVLKNQYLADLKISGQIDRRWYRCKISYQSEPNRTQGVSDMDSRMIGGIQKSGPPKVGYKT